MRGILDIDFLCLKGIFKFLTPLDLCSMRQSCTQLRDYVDDHCRSLYFVREQCLDLTSENFCNVYRILNNFGRYVRQLKVGGKTIESKLLLDVIAINCGKILKGLFLISLQLDVIDTERIRELFNNLEVLELCYCYGDKKCIENILLGHEYPSLTKVIVKHSNIGTDILKKFFMRSRNIKTVQVRCTSMRDDVLPLIARNAAEIEELHFFVRKYTRNVMSLVQLKKLKRLEINCFEFDRRPFIELIKGISVNNELEMLGIHFFQFTDDFCDALSNLTNLKELRCKAVEFTGNDTKPIEILARKLSKLESLMMVDCSDFPYREFLASACKSEKFRKIYVWDFYEIKNFIEQLVKDFSNGSGRHCFVSGKPLCIYLSEDLFIDVNKLLSQGNLQCIEKYGNIKILPTTFDVFFPTLI